jgi:hypothetical protein
VITTILAIIGFCGLIVMVAIITLLLRSWRRVLFAQSPAVWFCQDCWLHIEEGSKHFSECEKESHRLERVGTHAEAVATAKARGDALRAARMAEDEAQGIGT